MAVEARGQNRRQHAAEHRPGLLGGSPASARRLVPHAPRRRRGQRVEQLATVAGAGPSSAANVTSTSTEEHVALGDGVAQLGGEGPCTAAARRNGVTASSSAARLRANVSMRRSSGSLGSTGTTSTASRSTTRRTTAVCSAGRSSKCWKTDRTDTPARSAMRGAVGRRRPPRPGRRWHRRWRRGCGPPGRSAVGGHGGSCTDLQITRARWAPPASRGGAPCASAVDPAEDVDRRDRGPDLVADEVLVDGDPGHLAGHVDALVGQDELQVLRAAEQGEPRARHGGPAVQRRPARCVQTTSSAWCQMSDMASRSRRLEGVVEGAVGGAHGLESTCSASAADPTGTAGGRRRGRPGWAVAGSLPAWADGRPSRRRRSVPSTDGVTPRARPRRRRPPAAVCHATGFHGHDLGAAGGRAGGRRPLLGARLPRPRRQHLARIGATSVERLGRRRAGRRRRPGVADVGGRRALDGRRRPAAGRAAPTGHVRGAVAVRADRVPAGEGGGGRGPTRWPRRPAGGARGSRTARRPTPTSRPSPRSPLAPAALRAYVDHGLASARRRRRSS